jgi:hypothetical protein
MGSATFSPASLSLLFSRSGMVRAMAVHHQRMGSNYAIVVALWFCLQLELTIKMGVGGSSSDIPGQFQLRL